MSGVNISPWGNLRLQPQFLCRNGQIVNAFTQQNQAMLANPIACMRTKEMFRYGGGTGAIPSSVTGTRIRWRFAQHTGYMSRWIVARVLIALGTSPFGTPSVSLTIKNGAGSTLGSGSFSGIIISGAGLGIPDTPDRWTEGLIFIASNGFQNTDIFGEFDDVNGARLISATVYELAMPPDTTNGYVDQGYAIGSKIYDAHRSSVSNLGLRSWKWGTGSAFYYASDVDSASKTLGPLGTAKNIWDDGTGVPSSSTPGYTLDLRYKNTYALATVPCVFAAYGKGSVSNPTNYLVKILDGSNNVIVSLSGFGTSEGWVSTTVNMPASLAKYDVKMYNLDAAGTFTLRAVDLYEYLA